MLNRLKQNGPNRTPVQTSSHELREHIVLPLRMRSLSGKDAFVKDDEMSAKAF